MKIASRWFERKSFGDGLTLLWEPHVHEFLRCNIWHIRGRDKDMLIDTGLGVVSLRDEMADLIDKPLAAVATHIHYDHVGSLHEFDTRIMHHIEAPRMADYQEFCALTLDSFPQEVQEDLVAMGLPAGGNPLIDALPSEGFDLHNYAIRSALPTDEVKDGDTIDLGDRHFEVLHLPGHSPGSIGLWEAATGTFFGGDAIYDDNLLDQLPDSDIADYVATMRRIRDLPANVIHGGHGPSFGRQRMIEICNDYIERKETGT